MLQEGLRGILFCCAYNNGGREHPTNLLLASQLPELSMIPPCQWYQAIYALHATWPHLLIMNKEKFFTRML